MNSNSNRHFFFFALMLGVFFFTSLAFAKPAQLGRLSVQRKPHAWYFTFDLSKPVPLKISSLTNPSRIVLDLSNCRLSLSYHRAMYVNTPVKQLRIGYPSPGRTRLVFDLDYSVRVQAALIPLDRGHGYQLRVEFLGNKPKIIGFNQLSDPMTAHESASLPPPDSEVPASAYLTESVATTRFARPVVVVIDPGHGGKDPGALGMRGTREKNVVLALAKAVEEKLKDQKGFRVVLTRRGDYYIPLRQRLEIARRYKADLFISIHADAYRDRYAQGASIYALSQRGATSEAAHWLAQRENESEIMGGVSMNDKNNMLRSVLLNLSQTASIRSSLQVGESIIRFLRQFTSLHYTRVGQAAFVVLKAPDVPSILMESGFISNPYEERNLRNEAYRSRLADAVAKGVKDYFFSNPPHGTWLAMKREHRI